MKLKNSSNIYLLGIGGIGMSALARYFKSRDKQVAGYDRVRTSLCEELENEGMFIHYEDDVNLIPADFNQKNCLVIYTPAVPEDHTELNYFKNNGFDLLKRAQVLGELSKNHICLAVAGTHGKTTTSALLAYILRSAGKDITAFLGGISTNYQTNFLSGKLGDDNILVVEADEYDRSFLQLKPSGAIITSVDADHLDIYGNTEELVKTFEDFASNVSDNLIVKAGINISGRTYGMDKSADYYADNIRIKNHSYSFDIITPDFEIRDIISGLPGRHNVENAVGAATLALQYGISAEDIKNGIESFKGVRRRFEYHIQTDNLVYIDDYAHHPREISALLHSVRELYPHKKITGIFQPHLFSRTRDFADDFAESLSAMDELILMDIYPAREKPIASVNSEMLLKLVKLEDKKILSPDEIIKELKKRNREVVLSIGAGDIDKLINPIKMALLNG